MKAVSFTEFRKNASAVLNLVDKGTIIRDNPYHPPRQDNR
jgi:hypothetical protein